MSGPMEAVGVLRAAGGTDPGLQREVNEDRFHVDAPRGLFVVVDGVGGQAAGGKAADTAVSMLRARLERPFARYATTADEPTGSVVSRLREAITAANNEIHRLAGIRAEWAGMACVLTAVVVRGSDAIVGHVGDTRLYKLRRGQMEKITRDHSPVGEREDAREISELQAMQHPRRNEVYRDVGSEPHEPADPDFIEIQQVAFEPDAALLLCSDGLTDLVESATMLAIVQRFAGQPQMIVGALIDAANDAGGKDNVTVVYVEGEQFASSVVESGAQTEEITRRLHPIAPRASKRARRVRLANIALIAVVILLTFVRSDTGLPGIVPVESRPAAVDNEPIVVRMPGSISEALLRANSGATVIVEPGEYRETLTLKSGVQLISRVVHGATIRLPGTASEREAAIVAHGVTGASITGFRIVGDAATPLGIGISARDSDLRIAEMTIAGAARAAIEAGRASRVRVVASEIHDNPGAALAVRAGAAVTITHNVFSRNGTSGAAARALAIDESGDATFTSNVFVGSTASVFTGSSAARAAFARDNFFDMRLPDTRRQAGRGARINEPR